MERHRCAKCGCYFNWNHFNFLCPHCGFLNKEAEEKNSTENELEAKVQCPVCQHWYYMSIYKTCPKCKNQYGQAANDLFTKHIHSVQGKTEENEQHTHEINVLTMKAKLIEEEKNHVHFVSGETGEAKGHRHYFELYTEKGESVEDNHTHLLNADSFLKNGHTHKLIIKSDLGKTF